MEALCRFITLYRRSQDEMFQPSKVERRFLVYLMAMRGTDGLKRERERHDYIFVVGLMWSKSVHGTFKFFFFFNVLYVNIKV